MKIAIYPGSFDPITLGHLDIIRRGAACFDKLYVCVMVNCEKKLPMFTPERRLELIRRSVADIPNVEVENWSGLLADYARTRKATVLVKGLRAVSDFEYEFQMSLTNKKLNPELETVFLTTSAENMYLSSSIVKQIAMFGGDISDFVPACILKDIQDRLCR